MNAHYIRSTTRGKRAKSAYGFQWRKYEGNNFPIEAYKINIPPESKEKIVHKRKVSQYSLDGIFIRTYPSIKDAEFSLNITHSSISKCCKGKRKTDHGFIWKYA